MMVTAAGIPDVRILQPRVFADSRGFFFESFNERVLREAGIDAVFVQDNHSRSARHVLRGLHYQIEQAQGKLVRVVRGAVLDVAVDLRRSSPWFGRHVAIELSEENRTMVWIPPGFAHGFVVRSESADFLYKTTDYYAAAHERCIAWDDPALAIDWRLTGPPVLSPKDAAAPRLHAADTFA